MAMFWTKFLFYLKKISVFLKNYGLVIALAVSFLYALVFAKRKQEAYNQLLKEMQNQVQRHNDEVDALEKAHQEELKRYAEIDRQYNETITRIQVEHQQALEQLDRQKKDELRQIITETHNDPVRQATRINSLFGIPVVNTPSN